MSAWVIDVATGRAPGLMPSLRADDVFDDDFQLALYLAQEVHFSDVPGFMPGLDSDAVLVGFRAPRLHAYLDELPASALAITTLVSTFGLSRCRRGALVGHLAAFEMSSVERMGRYAAALRRMGAPPAA